MTHLVDWVRINGIHETDHLSEGEPPRKDWEIIGEWQPSLTCAIDAPAASVWRRAILCRSSRLLAVRYLHAPRGKSVPGGVRPHGDLWAFPL